MVCKLYLDKTVESESKQKQNQKEKQNQEWKYGIDGKNKNYILNIYIKWKSIKFSNLR